MGLTGVNVMKFAAQITRGASFTPIRRNGVPITDILNNAGWSSGKKVKYNNSHITKNNL